MKANRNRFRAWDGKQMLFSNFHDKNWFDNKHNCVCSRKMGDHHGLMQSTGLTDTNGVEIFEGDIIKWEGDECDFFHAVTWSLSIPTKSHRFIETCGWYGYNPFYGDIDAVWTVCGGNEEEVVGNVHETPELLNSKEQVKP